jgi:hypothetical protein
MIWAGQVAYNFVCYVRYEVSSSTFPTIIILLTIQKISLYFSFLISLSLYFSVTQSLQPVISYVYFFFLFSHLVFFSLFKTQLMKTTLLLIDINALTLIIFLSSIKIKIYIIKKKKTL